MDLALRFLGVGNAQARALGNSAAVFEVAGNPSLLIDCGPLVPGDYRARYGDAAPQAIFITHTHFDHIGGLEALFYSLACARPRPPLVRLYVPAHIIETLSRRMASDPAMLAEGGVNFWDVFQLIPVGEYLWHAGMRFDVFPVQHHEHLSAYGLALRGRFLYSGDTRPIPDVLRSFAAHGEAVFHDCGLHANPSHTGLDDLERYYTAEQRRHLLLYHYESAAAGAALRAQGYRVVEAGVPYRLAASDDRPDLQIVA